MKIIAHRGDMVAGPENSFLAFESAVSIGCHRIELDVQLTNDQVPVVFHDLELFRMTGELGPLANLSWKTLQAYSLEGTDQRIPSLEGVISQFLPRIELNIEFKSSEPELVDLAAGMVMGSDLESKVIFSSFHLEPLLYLREHYPKLQRAVLLDGFASKAVSLMNRVASHIIHPQGSMVTASFMNEMRHRGWTVYPWFGRISEESSQRVHLWAKLHVLGVDGLCTNYPRELIAWLGKA